MSLAPYTRILRMTALCCALGTGVGAAELVTGSAQGACDATLRGEIRQGDAEAVQAWLEAAPETPLTAPPRLCLDSQSGSYPAALALARVVARRGLATAVPAEASCDGACALGFLAAPPRERQVAPSARLAIAPPPLSDSFGDPEIAYADALQVLHDIFQMRENGQLHMTDALFMALLSTPPATPHVLETVGEAALWQVPVAPVQPPESARESFMTNLCANALASRTGQSQVARSTALQLVDSAVEAPDGSLRVTTLPAWAEAAEAEPMACQLTLFAAGGDAPVSGEIAFLSAGFIEALAPFDAFLAYPAATPLTALEGGGSADLRALLLDSAARPYAPGAGDSCWLRAAEARVVNVTDYVNLRSATGFSAEILQQLPADTPLALVSNPLAAGSEADQQACASACRAAATGPDSEATGAAVRACIDRNAIWYKVRTEEGTEGFVSRKFLGVR